MSKLSKLNEKTPLWPQWFASFQVFLLIFSTGMTFGFVSPFLGRLTRADPPFIASKEQTTWIASLIFLNQAVGALIGTTVVAFFGSKTSLYISGCFIFLSWFCLLLASSMVGVFLFLSLNGVGRGILYVSYPLYMGEIANAKIRGILVCCCSQGFNVGSLCGNILGAYLDCWILAVVNLVPITLFLSTFYFFPHTPTYLLRNKKVDIAAKSIEWYDRKADSGKEVASLSDFLSANPSKNFFATLPLLNTAVNRSILIKILIIFGFDRLNGVYTVMEYMELLFTKANVTIVRPSTLVTCLGILGVLGSWLSMYTTHKFGRVTILTTTYLSLTLAAAGWGLAYHLLDIGFSDTNLQWLVAFSASVYRLCISIGLAPLLPTLMSECFAPNIKNVASCVSFFTASVCVFIASKKFQFLLDNLTHKYVFYMFSGVALFLGVFVKVLLPETKGKSLQEIQESLHKEKTVNSNDNR